MLQPTTPEQRKDIYEDVLQLLAPGFLSHSITVQNINLSLRTLNPGDLHLLEARLSPTPTEREYRSWLIAGSVWMVDGVVVLGDRRTAKHVYDVVVALPTSILSMLYFTVVGLLHRLHEAADYAEAFSYEDNSKTLWEQMGTSFNEVSGIPGSETIGRNAIQQIWVAINRMDDKRQIWLQDWECAKLVASTQAYKAVKKMSKSEQTHQGYEDQRRQEVKDRAYWKFKGYLVDTPEFQSKQGPLMHTKSADELMDEYKRWVEGEQDWHDQVVAAYKNKIKRAVEAEAARIQALNDAYDQEVKALGLPESSPGIVGYTPEQIQGILKRAQQENSRLRGARTISNQDSKFRNYEKFLKPKEKPVNLSVSDVFQSESDVPSLDERIADRKVRLDARESK